MNKRIIFGALVIMALFLVPGTSRARMYNANTGRFMTMDSYEGRNQDPQSLHKYTYCANNPVNNIDPSGHEDISSVLATMSIGASLAALPGISVTPPGAISTGSSCGPDVTVPVMNTMNDVERTFFSAPYATKVNAAANILTHPIDTMVKGWDIEPLFDLGYTIPVAFGNGSTLGTGLGAYTVQFGIPPKVYYAGSVNYIMWGRLNSLLHYTFKNPLTGVGDPISSETAAVTAARTWKALGHHDVFDKYATEAGAFVKFGYSATDPSSTALPLAPNPNNVAAPDRFKWRWLGLHDTFQ